MTQPPAGTSFRLVALIVLGTIVFLSLGTWQLQRRSWKLDLIAQVEQKLATAPIAAPAPAQWPALQRSRFDYQPVRLSGHFLNDRETPVQAVTEHGPGFWIMTPMQSDGGFVVLVNRGFVPADRRDAATRPESLIAGEVTVLGLMRRSEPSGGFLRSNDAAANRWYSRDVAAISLARGLAGVAPYFVDADAAPNKGGLPIGGLTVTTFRNPHLVYALTWFSLAFLLVATAFHAIRRGRNARVG